jgi:hypothetical protein
VPVGYIHPETLELRGQVEAQRLTVQSAQEKVDQAKSNLKILAAVLKQQQVVLSVINNQLNVKMRAADRKMTRARLPQVP